MDDTRLSDLHPAGALSDSDLFYVVQNPGSGGEKATGTQLLTLVGTTYLAKAGGTMTGALTIASGTLAASSPALTITQTWNNAAVDFDAIVVDATRTASSAASFLLNLKLAGTSKFQVRYDGNVVMAAGAAIYTAGATGGAWNYNTAGESAAATRFALPINSPDVMLYRDAAASLALRNGANQQSFCVYNNESSSLTNYERLKLTGVAGASVNITAESLGTGSANLDVVITPKGTGAVKFGTHTASADQAVSGYITIKDAGGTTRKLAVIS